MANDPAILWYWDSWIGGTVTLSRAMKGAYMDLLGAQHSSGHLSLDEIKTVLGSDFGSMWPTLQKKFVKDDKGLYYNVKAKEVKEKRKAFTDSRKKNLSPKDSPHMEGHVINRDINIIHPFKSEEWLKTWERWLNHRNAIKKPYKSIDSEQEQLNWFTQKKYTELQSIEVVMKSIRNGYQGIFDLDERANIKSEFPDKWDKELFYKLQSTDQNKWRGYIEHLKNMGFAAKYNQTASSLKGTLMGYFKQQQAA